MDTRLQQECSVSAWQATNLMFWRLFKDKLMLTTNTTDRTHVHPRKEMTMEALLLIVVVTIFVIFSVLGSLSTVFEFVYRENIEKKKLSKNTPDKKFTKNFSKKSKRKMSYIDANNKNFVNKMRVIFKRCNSIFLDLIRNNRSFLHCFCLIKNGKQLFQTNGTKKQFQCFHGIRVISNLSIICFHIGLLYLYTSMKLKPFLSSPLCKILFNTNSGVDAFFVLSGFLNAYSFSKAYEENNGKISWRKFYLKRFLRLTPAYMIVLGFYTTLLCYTGSGPIWPEYATNPVCKENWWRYLFYINNFELSVKSCMLWCWHLATEMQMFAVSPIILLSLHRCQGFGYGLAIVTIFLSGLSSFLITKNYNLIVSNSVQIDLHIGKLDIFLDRFWIYIDKLYYKPYTRISPYLIGVLLGYNFRGKNVQDTRNRRITLWFGWITSGLLIWISFFALLKREESVMESALYNSVKHLFFSLGLSWIIFVCLTRQGGFIDAFLSWKLFFPFSKLSYCAYLIHMLIIQRDYQAAKDIKEFSLSSAVLYAFHVYFWSCVTSIPVSLLFEMTILNLFDLYTKKGQIEKREARKDYE